MGYACNGKAVVLQEGMVVTDEPGVYLPHKLGIRIENEMIVKRKKRISTDSSYPLKILHTYHMTAMRLIQNISVMKRLIGLMHTTR